jgi:hypothetical protein
VYTMIEQKLLDYNASWIEIATPDLPRTNTVISSGFNN